MMVKVSGCIFLLKMMNYWKNKIVFRIKSVLISKKEFNSKIVCNKIFLYIQINCYGDRVKDFHVKGILQVDFNNTCLAVISLVSALKKDEVYYLQVFLKIVNALKKKKM